MIFGGVESERIQLNEDTVWAGEKRDRNNPEGAQAIREVRRLLADGKPREAEVLADKSILSIPRRLPPYQTLGDLHLRFAGHGSPTNYTRSLDLDTGIARVEYTSGGARFTSGDIFVRDRSSPHHPPRVRPARENFVFCDTDSGG